MELRHPREVEAIPFPPPPLLDSIGTYLEHRCRQNFCNLLIINDLKWWRRGESEFGSPLIPRNLLILLKARNAKNTGFAQVRYTAGTPTRSGANVFADWHFKNTDVRIEMIVLAEY